MSAIDELSQNARGHFARLRQAKKDGVKLIGHTGRFVPEELIRAAGAIPHYLGRGGEPEAPEAVLPYMLRFMSPFSRAQIGYHLLGMDPFTRILDVIVAQCDDCHMSRLADLLEYFKLPTFRIGVPPDWDKELSFEYYYKALVKFKQRLEEITGRPITENNLQASVFWTNEVRNKLSKISGLRMRPLPPIGGYDFIRLQHYAFYCEPQLLSIALDRMLSELERARGTGSEKSPRLLLAGHVVAVGDYTVPKLIEEAGGMIVAEFLDEGHWFYYRNVPYEGDLLRNLALTYYKGRVPPTGFQPAWQVRFEHIKRLISEYKVQGVVWYQLSFEEIYDMECTVMARKINELGLPFLKLESSYEYAREAMAPLMTRIESFVKSIEIRGS